MVELSALVDQVLDGKYRLEELLGQGGMGAVFRATHLGTDRVVALKLISPGLMDQGEFLERFQREARATGRLRHPNIVDLTDFGFAELEGRRHAYLVMEYLVGCTLADVLREEKHLPVRWVVDVLAQVCAGLQKAHDHGIVHRDLKPDNIWLEPGERGAFTAKILDFGLAKIYDPKARADGRPGLPVEDPGTVALPATAARGRLETEAMTGQAPALTQTGSVLGTPTYMSPEQCRGVAMDHRADLYSIGVIAYQMFAGAPPFSGNSLDLINSHIQSTVPPLQALRKDLHPGIGRLVMDALAKDPRERPQSAEVFAGALQAYAETTFSTWKKALDFYPERPGQLTFLAFKAALPNLAILLIYGLWALAGHPHPVAVTAVVGILCFACLSLGGTIVGGRVMPMTLRWLAEPLGGEIPPAPGIRAWKRDRLLLLVQTVIPFGLIFGGQAILFSHGEASGELTWGAPAFIGISLTALGFLLLWGVMRRTGSAQGGSSFLPCILLFEGVPYEEAKARSRSLTSNPLARTGKTGLTFLQAIATMLCVDIVVLPGLAIGLLLGETTASNLAVGGYMLAMCWLILIVLAPVSNAHGALEYVQARRLCREPLRKDFAAFHRQAVGAAQWAARVQESIRTAV